MHFEVFDITTLYFLILPDPHWDFLLANYHILGGGLGFAFGKSLGSTTDCPRPLQTTELSSWAMVETSTADLQSCFPAFHAAKTSGFTQNISSSFHLSLYFLPANGISNGDHLHSMKKCSIAIGFLHMVTKTLLLWNFLAFILGINIFTLVIVAKCYKSNAGMLFNYACYLVSNSW